MNHNGRVIRVLFDEDEIAARNIELAREIASAGYNKLLVVAILNGSFVFAADLIRSLHWVCAEDEAFSAGTPSPEIAFIAASSYVGGTESSGNVELGGFNTDVKGREVLIVDDILESGRTLAKVRGELLKRGAKKVDIAVLLRKKGKILRALQPLKADFVGFDCPNEFVFGYGMDSAGKWRQLPHICYV